MAKKAEGEPDNLVLQMLREIREEIRDVKRGQKDLKTSVDDLKHSMPYALGLSAQANMRSETIHQQLEDLRERVERLEAKN